MRKGHGPTGSAPSATGSPTPVGRNSATLCGRWRPKPATTPARWGGTRECRASRHRGEGHGRGEEPGSAAAKDSPAYRARNASSHLQKHPGGVAASPGESSYGGSPIGSSVAPRNVGVLNDEQDHIRPRRLLQRQSSLVRVDGVDCRPMPPLTWMNADVGGGLPATRHSADQKSEIVMSERVSQRHCMQNRPHHARFPCRAMLLPIRLRTAEPTTSRHGSLVILWLARRRPCLTCADGVIGKCSRVAGARHPTAPTTIGPQRASCRRLR